VTLEHLGTACSVAVVEDTIRDSSQPVNSRILATIIDADLNLTLKLSHKALNVVPQASDEISVYEAG
jgi:hypothetical protein